MRYRRNVDEQNRALERQFQADISRSEEYAIALIRARQLPTLPPRWPRSHPTPLSRFFDYIDQRYWVQYLTLILNLLKLGVAFELRPGGPSCNCENSGCQHETDNTLCFTCDTHTLVPIAEYYDLTTARALQCTCGRRLLSPPNNLLCDWCGEILSVTSIIQAEDDQGRPVLICTQCKQTRSSYPPGQGPCSSGFPWRAYEDQLGGLCDSCMSDYPMDYHSHVCQCARCNNGIGPLIILRTRLVSEEHLHKLLSAYNSRYPTDDRIFDVPFRFTRDDEYTLEDWRRQDSDSISLSDLSLSCIELRRDGSYRLRKYQHLNERQIPPRFLEMLHQRLADTGPSAAKQLFQYHMLGRDFDLPGIVSHLDDNSPPNMQEFIYQVYLAVRDIISFDDVFRLNQIHPNLYHYECVGVWTPEALAESRMWRAGSQNLDDVPLVEYPVRIVFDRSALDDGAEFWLYGTDRVEYSFNRPLRAQDEFSIEKLNTRLGWALDRVQRSPETMQIDPDRLTYLQQNMCRHGYQRNRYATCPHC